MIPRSGAPRRSNVFKQAEKFNPIVFNRITEFYVKAGKEKAVGLWLAGISTSIFIIVVVGGYTRLTKSGLSMVKWEPHRLLPPISKEESFA